MEGEIGSEFWDIPIGEENQIFPQETAWFLSGRRALDFVLADIRNRLDSRPLTAALPSWCCHTIIEPFLANGFQVRFYPVLPELQGGLHMDFSEAMSCDVLLAMEYFGYRGKSIPSDFHGIVIHDATHSLLAAPPEEGDYVFGSLRKWAGFWTGGYAWRRDRKFDIVPSEETDSHYIDLRHQAMTEKREYLSGQREDKGYLSVFSEAEELLEKRSAGTGAAERDVAAAKRLDVAFLRKKRRENAEKLLESVSHMAVFPHLGEQDCPLFVPILVPNGKRDALGRFLIEKDIYCPVHWPMSPLHRLTPQTKRLYEEELSLVCDQRYEVEDMGRVCKAIREFFKREK